MILLCVDAHDITSAHLDRHPSAQVLVIDDWDRYGTQGSYRGGVNALVTGMRDTLERFKTEVRQFAQLVANLPGETYWERSQRIERAKRAAYQRVHRRVPKVGQVLGWLAAAAPLRRHSAPRFAFYQGEF